MGRCVRKRNEATSQPERDRDVELAISMLLAFTTDIFPLVEEAPTVKPDQPCRSNLHTPPRDQHPHFPPFFQVLANQSEVALCEISAEGKEGRAQNQAPQDDKEEASW